MRAMRCPFSVCAPSLVWRGGGQKSKTKFSFANRSFMRKPRHFFGKNFGREPNCTGTEAFGNRGSTVYQLINIVAQALKPF